MRIKKYVRTILLAILAICLIIAPALLSISTNKLETVATAQTAILPAQYVGVWRGSGVQKNGSQWSILITLIAGEVDSIVGTIAYPSLSCGGELSMRKVNQDSIELFEELTYGISSCVNNGTTTLQRASAKKLNYSWHKQSSTQDATGSVQKISSN
jgi:hypothetical protein